MEKKLWKSAYKDGLMSKWVSLFDMMTLSLTKSVVSFSHFLETALFKKRTL